MKAIVVQFNSSCENAQYVEAAVKDITRVVVSLLGATHVEVTTMDDKDVSTAIINAVAHKAAKAKVKLDVSIAKDPIISACEYVAKLYADDVRMRPAEDVEKDLMYNILKLDNIHSAKLEEACKIIYNNKKKAALWFADNHINTLFTQICNVIKMTNK